VCNTNTRLRFDIPTYSEGYFVHAKYIIIILPPSEVLYNIFPNVFKRKHREEKTNKTQNIIKIKGKTGETIDLSGLGVCIFYVIHRYILYKYYNIHNI